MAISHYGTTGTRNCSVADYAENRVRLRRRAAIGAAPAEAFTDLARELRTIGRRRVAPTKRNRLDITRLFPALLGFLKLLDYRGGMLPVRCCHYRSRRAKSFRQLDFTIPRKTLSEPGCRRAARRASSPPRPAYRRAVIQRRASWLSRRPSDEHGFQASC